jgi:hypothetical protein
MRMFKKKKKGGEKIYITEQNFHCENFQNNKRRKGKNTKKKEKNIFLNFLFFSFKVFVCPSCIRCPAQQQQQHTADGGTTKRERGVPKWFYDSLFSHTVEGGRPGAAFLSKISQFFVVLCVPVGGTFSSSKKRRGRRRKKKS